MDVVALVGDMHVIVIEDKTDTGHHSNQLQRYRESTDGRWGEGKGDRRPILVYLKTGEQACYVDVESKGWKVFSRRQLLGLLREAGSIDDSILRDFVRHVESIERETMAYETVAVGSWGKRRRLWQGFFHAIRSAMGTGWWQYVANPTGGFVGFWWSHVDVGDGCRLCLQLEEAELVVKVDCGAADSATRKWVRDVWSAKVTGLVGEPPSRNQTVRLVTRSPYPN